MIDGLMEGRIDRWIDQVIFISSSSAISEEVRGEKLATISTRENSLKYGLDN